MKTDINPTTDFLNEIYIELEHNHHLANFVLDFAQHLQAQHGNVGLHLGAMAQQIVGNLEQLAHSVNKKIQG